MRNWIEGTPVVPLFAADITANDISKGMVFQQTDTRMAFPDVPHIRGTDAQQELDKIGYEKLSR